MEGHSGSFGNKESVKVSILLPTCHRPEMLRNMLQSLEDTTEGFDIETVFVIDEDMESVRVAVDFLENNEGILSFSPFKRGALFGWNRALELSSGSYLVPSGDDQLFHADWLRIALDAHQAHCVGFGVVGMNDLAYDGDSQLATMFLFDRTYCKCHMGGVFAPPMYHYYNIDSEWNAKAKELGCFYWERNSVVEHLHVAHGKRDYDLHDKLKEDSMWMAIDNLIFEDRKARCFPIFWESLI